MSGSTTFLELFCCVAHNCAGLIHTKDLDDWGRRVFFASSNQVKSDLSDFVNE